jgi:soluble lytic murein transglycosylase-like protein
MRRSLFCAFAGIFVALECAVPAAAGAQPRPVAAACGPAIPLAEPIERASDRFAMPVALIRAVIAAESNFMVRAVSPKGAMGLMQLMPGTWAELRLRYALGADPFDPCDNIMAGTAYLRELLDRYGDPGFLAAYNAGPGRYEAYLRGARGLPSETLAYVARLSAAPRGGAPAAPRVAADPDAWTRGGLFAAASDQALAPVAEAQPAQRPGPVEDDAERPLRLPANTIFVPRTGAPQ